MRRIGVIENFYGGLFVKEEASKYYWGIENYSGIDWQEIPFTLYNELIKFQDEV